jgi:hypothetical protein
MDDKPFCFNSRKPFLPLNVKNLSSEWKFVEITQQMDNLRYKRWGIFLCNTWFGDYVQSSSWAC